MSFQSIRVNATSLSLYVSGGLLSNQYIVLYCYTAHFVLHCMLCVILSLLYTHSFMYMYCLLAELDFPKCLSLDVEMHTFYCCLFHYDIPCDTLVIKLKPPHIISVHASAQILRTHTV